MEQGWRSFKRMILKGSQERQVIDKDPEQLKYDKGENVMYIPTVMAFKLFKLKYSTQILSSFCWTMT